MNTCGLTRVLVPAFFIGFAVSALAGREIYGWVVAGSVAVVVVLFGRRRDAGGTCSLSDREAVSSGVVDGDRGT